MSSKQRHVTHVKPPKRKKSAVVSRTNEVWLLDDDSALLQAFKYILQEEGFVPHLFIAPRQLWSALRHSRPCIVFVDLMLAGISGGDVISKLKSDSKTADLPAILISGAPNTAQLAHACGADGYIEKPCGIDEVLQKIADHSNSH